MPFIQRVVEPKYLSRTSLHDENNKPVISDCELEAVTNNTLSNALRQLASLVLVANDIFLELTKQLENVQERSRTLKSRIETVDGKISRFDPKKVTVPESDISTFALLRNHYVRKQDLTSSLFSTDTRPRCVRALYAAAAKTPIHVMRQMDRWRRDGHRTSRYFLCTPVLGAKRRKLQEKIDMEIETRMPAAVEELRRWTSDEALGDITVPPDCINRINVNLTKLQSATSAISSTDQTDVGSVTSGDEGVDHKLPSPEEQIIAIANKFPAEVVAVDVSLKRFNRVCAQRRSLLHVDVASRGGAQPKEADGGSENTNDGEDSTLRRRSRTRKPRGKRRNTIAGTDQKEIEEAVLSREQPSTTNAEPEASESTKSKKVVIRSKSSDLLRSSKKESPSDLGGSTTNTATKKSHFNSLKQWGKNRLKMINLSFDSKSNDTLKTEDIDDVNIYETIITKRRSNIDKISKSTTSTSTESSTKPPCISTEKSSNIPISTPISGAMSMAVKLRESAAQRRQRRNGVNKDEPHSSSGNWSASSESGRTSIGSEITTSTTTQPKSTTSCGTSNNSLNTHSLVPSSVASRRKFINTSNSSSVTSEGTLTPDIIHDLHDDDGESSVYSCDTEGYYTSFHVDSGLKTLKEEDVSLPSTPLQITSAFHDSPNRNNMSAESEYELFGKGSTSTTTSSAGTVCTTLMASGSQRSLLNGPAVPERKSSLSKLESSQDPNKVESTGTIKRNTSSGGNKATVIAMVHKQSKGDESPDSGHNTSSSPIESINSPNGQRSCSEFEFSESSDLEGVDRIERIRLKTTINSSRIPSMCVITPPHSDDESVKSVQRYEIPNKRKILSQKTPSEHSTESEQDEKHSTRNEAAHRKAPLETDIDADLPINNQPSRIVVASVEGTKKIQVINVNPVSGYATVQTYDSKTPEKEEEKTEKETKTNQPLLKSTLQPLNNMLGKLRTNISNLAHRNSKTPPKDSCTSVEVDICDSGEYVTIADVRNNNKSISSSTTYYANDVIKRNLDNVLSGQIKDTEYVSLNELPSKIDAPESSNEDSLERRKRQGARVTLDAEGKVVYSSDSLRRRKGAHTTFEPGPFVKDPSTTTPVASPLLTHRTPKIIRPVGGGIQDANRPLSPQLGKVVIRATSKSTFGGSTPPPTADFIRMPPTTIVTPNSTTPLSPKVTPPARGAYVNMQDPTLVSSGHSEGPALFKYSNSPQISTIDVLKSPYIDHQLHIMHQPVQYHQYTEQLSSFDVYDRRSSVYRTLPSRKPPPSTVFCSDIQRSVTPDITRGLYQSPTKIPYKTEDVPRQTSPQPKPIQTPANFASSTPTKQTSTGTSKIPMGISNFFSPIHGKEKPTISSPPTNSPKISPIDPRNTGQEFKSSTPTSKPLEIKSPTATNLSSKLIPPKKSTMSYDELYAVIYKNKKKFNIGTIPDDTAAETENLTRDRHSWSPNNKETGQITSNLNKEPPGSRQSWAPNTVADRRIPVAKTSTMDFKRLLLSKSSPISSPSTKMSAVEQLKLTKPQATTNQQSTGIAPINILDLSNSPRSLANRKFNTSPGGSPVRHGTDNKQRVVPKLMLSPRSAWRFASPRSDVLSSTILEDCREDESPNNSLEKDKNSSQQFEAKTLNNDVSKKTSTIESDQKLSSENITTIRQQIPKSENNSSSVQPISPTSGLTGMSRAQYLQAQKAQFFLSSGNNSTSNIVQQQNTSSESSKSTKCPSPPALETAL